MACRGCSPPFDAARTAPTPLQDVFREAGSPERAEGGRATPWSITVAARPRRSRVRQDSASGPLSARSITGIVILEYQLLWNELTRICRFSPGRPGALPCAGPLPCQVSGVRSRASRRLRPAPSQCVRSFSRPGHPHSFPQAYSRVPDPRSPVLEAPSAHVPSRITSERRGAPMTCWHLSHNAV